MPKNASLCLTVAIALVGVGLIIIGVAVGTAIAQAKDAPFECHIPDLKMPSKFKVYAASAHNPGPPLPLKLNDSENEARLVEVRLNSPDEPVALMLGAFQPTIWHFSWTEGTKVTAVVVSGYYPPLVMGLPGDVPILDTRKFPSKTCPRIIEVEPGDKLIKTNEFARHLFNRDIDQTSKIQDGRIVFGEPLSDDSKLLTEEEFSYEKFTNPDKPLTFKVALDDAERKGLIRKAVKSDVQSYLKALAQGAGLPARLVDEGLRLNAYEIRWGYEDTKLYDSYVVLSNKFEFPTNLYPLSKAVRYILPEGILRPDITPEHSEIFSVAEAKSPNSPGEKIGWVCGAADLRLPANVKVYAGSGFLSSPVDIPADDKYTEAELVPIIINSPNEPVALILQNLTFRPTIWHFRWTEGTKIAAVVANGRTIGLPSETQVLKLRDCQSVPDKQAVPPGLQFPTSINSEGSVAKLAAINELSKQLFKKDVGQLYFVENGGSVIGEPLKDDLKLLTSEELKTEDWINPDALPGRASSMTQDILNGKIRRATVADMWSRAAAVAREAGLPEHIIKQITLYNRTRIDGHSRAYQEANPIPNTYMVLSPEFSIPAKLYQAAFKPIKSFHYDIRSASATFLYPDGSRTRCSYSPNDSKYAREGASRDIVSKPDSSQTSCYNDNHDKMVSMIKPKPIPEGCGISDFKPPADLKVYAVGASPSAGSHLNIPLYNKDRMDVGLVRLTINSPREAVALMLDGSNPNIWHLNWTVGTKIVAVVFSNGFYSQRISGLPEGVPVLYSGGACPGFSVSPRGIFSFDGETASAAAGLNALSNHLFRTDVEGLYEVRGGRAFVGPAPLEEMRLETAKEFNEEDFISPDMPPAGLSGITYAVGKGLIRKAEEADYRQWLSKYYRNIRNMPEDKIEEAIKSDNNQPDAPPKFRDTYVILSDDYLVPPMLPESYKNPKLEIDFIVPEDVSVRPEQSWNFSTFYMLKDGTCQGRGASPKCRAK